MPAPPERSALPLTGDDETVKQEAAQLPDTLGYDTVDTGTPARSCSRRAHSGGTVRKLVAAAERGRAGGVLPQGA
ncbi:hypothetical protein [Streptomyces griseoluteus]|uniref:hypothetical protein n=1 Tax=Streptomyces griseoluteus TaxID=29306 RepID=UPI003814B55F